MRHVIVVMAQELNQRIVFKKCLHCGGKGGEKKTERTPFGMMSQVSTCSKCGSLGMIITERCRKCDGNGHVQAKRKVEVVIPPGVNDGHTMQIRGEGNFDNKSGTERALVEKLTSLTAFREGRYFSSDDSGKSKGKFVDFLMKKDTESDASSKGTETAKSLWGSIKNFLRAV